MWRGDPATLFNRRRVVVFDFEIISTGLFEIDRVSKMSLVWFGDAFDLVLRLVIGNVFIRLRDFSRIGHAKAVVIGVRLIGGVWPALVNHQTPGCIWMF